MQLRGSRKARRDRLLRRSIHDSNALDLDTVFADHAGPRLHRGQRSRRACRPLDIEEGNLRTVGRELGKTYFTVGFGQTLNLDLRLAGSEVSADGGDKNVLLTALATLAGAQKSQMPGVLRPGGITVSAMTGLFRGAHLRCMRRVIQGCQHEMRASFARARISQHGAIRRNRHSTDPLALAQSFEHLIDMSLGRGILRRGRHSRDQAGDAYNERGDTPQVRANQHSIHSEMLTGRLSF